MPNNEGPVVSHQTPLVPPDFVRDRYAEILQPGEMLALEVLFSVRSSAQAMDRVVAGWLGPDALSPGRSQVLMVLWAHGKPVPQREIVTALNVSRANVSVLVSSLADEGYVTLLPDKANKRQVLASLTLSGKEMTLRLVRETAAGLRQRLAISDVELKLLADLLARALG